MTSTPTAGGRREQRDGRDHLVLERTFRASPADVWAAVTEPDRLARWIGTWTGDPASGSVDFRMTAEGKDAGVEVYRIVLCDPPARLVLQTHVPGEEGDWWLELDLAETDGLTTLTFAQRMSDPDLAASVGPGWEYYLDRLVAAETGSEVAAVRWDDYHPALAGYYRSLFSAPTPAPRAT